MVDDYFSFGELGPHRTLELRANDPITPLRPHQGSAGFDLSLLRLEQDEDTQRHGVVMEQRLFYDLMAERHDHRSVQLCPRSGGQQSDVGGLHLRANGCGQSVVPGDCLTQDAPRTPYSCPPPIEERYGHARAWPSRPGLGASTFPLPADRTIWQECEGPVKTQRLRRHIYLMRGCRQIETVRNGHLYQLHAGGFQLRDRREATCDRPGRVRRAQPHE